MFRNQLIQVNSNWFSLICVGLRLFSILSLRLIFCMELVCSDRLLGWHVGLVCPDTTLSYTMDWSVLVFTIGQAACFCIWSFNWFNWFVLIPKDFDIFELISLMCYRVSYDSHWCYWFSLFVIVFRFSFCNDVQYFYYFKFVLEI